jgi:hypothetical protein
MDFAAELIKQGRKKELWDRCCGYVDLTIDEFMNIQYQLLLEQVELLKKCELGRKIMRGVQPSSVAEFRHRVPITTYSDYAPYLLDKREDVLPEKPVCWQWTSGRSGEYAHKWAPITKRMYDELGELTLGLFILGACKERGDVALEYNDKLIYGIAPPPYASGTYFRRLSEMDIFKMLPPIDEAEKMGFEERIEQGFRSALSEGIDVMGAISSVLVTIGERFDQGGGIKRAVALLNQPKALVRLLRAVVKSKLAGHPLLPRDIWSPKALMACGTDNAIYRDKIKYLWGKYPLDIYGVTEGNIIATQTWDYGTMTFNPHLNFLEFMPEKEWDKWLMDKTYRPDLLLLDEVQPGQTYAMIVTNFKGGAFVRYFIGDAVKITSLRNEKCNINLPQMVFDSRVDGIIDLAGFTRLTEKIIWQAVESSGLPYQDWAVRKEAIQEKPILHLYIELKPGHNFSNDDVTATFHEQLKTLDPDYASLESMINLKPLKVTVLPGGSFQSYIASQRAAGSDLAHLKPPHVNPTQAQIDKLLTPAS